MNKPDKWIVVKIGISDPIYKVFATWMGGYLDGDYWRMNSGITHVTEEGEYLNFYGHSGSCYQCLKGAYGTSGFSQGVIDKFIENAKKQNIVLEILPDDADFLNISC